MYINKGDMFFECLAELVSSLTDGSKIPMESIERTGEEKGFRDNFDILINKIKEFRVMGKEVQYVQQLVPHSVYIVKVAEVKDNNVLEYLGEIAKSLQVNFILFDKSLDIISCPPGYQVIRSKPGPQIIS
jgi:hypothetical protein